MISYYIMGKISINIIIRVSINIVNKFADIKSNNFQLLSN